MFYGFFTPIIIKTLYYYNTLVLGVPIFLGTSNTRWRPGDFTIEAVVSYPVFRDQCCKQRLLTFATFESCYVCEQWEFYPGKLYNQSQRSITVMWLHRMNYSSSRITLFCRLIDYGWRHVRFGQNEWWLFISKLLNLIEITTGNLCGSERLDTYGRSFVIALLLNTARWAMRFGVSSLKDKQKSTQIFWPIFWMKDIYLCIGPTKPRRDGTTKLYAAILLGLCVAMITYIMYM